MTAGELIDLLVQLDPNARVVLDCLGSWNEVAGVTQRATGPDLPTRREFYFGTHAAYADALPSRPPALVVIIEGRERED